MKQHDLREASLVVSMTDKNKRYLQFSILAALLGAALLTLNAKFPSAVESLYTQGATGLLKKVTFTEVSLTRPLDYYVGKIEDMWVGPLTSVVTGGLFLLFCLWFLLQSWLLV